MAFADNAEFEDDFRKVGPDATAGFAPGGTGGNPAEHASSENLDVAGKADVADDDLEEDEDEGDLDEDDDLDDEDLEDDDDDEVVAEDEDTDDLEDDDLDDDDDDEGDDDEDLEDDADAVKARLKDAETTARGR